MGTPIFQRHRGQGFKQNIRFTIRPLAQYDAKRNSFVPYTDPEDQRSKEKFKRRRPDSGHEAIA